jgi:hypothetical protein
MTFREVYIDGAIPIITVILSDSEGSIGNMLIGD